MKVIFCIPGNSFSNRFLKCWTNLTRELHKRDIEYELLSQYIPNVYKVRSLLLGADRTFGQYQAPWQGKKEYDISCGLIQTKYLNQMIFLSY